MPSVQQAALLGTILAASAACGRARGNQSLESNVSDLDVACGRAQGNKSLQGNALDLDAMRLELHRDHYGRLATLSPDDLVRVLAALGYATGSEGKVVIVIVDTPGIEVNFHGTTLRGKSAITVSSIGHMSVEFEVCAASTESNEAQLQFADNWNRQRRLSQTWVKDHGIYLGTHILLTKYDRANLQLLGEGMKVFLRSYQDFLDEQRKAGATARRDRRLANATLDDLVHRLREEQLGGEMPDLDALVAQQRADGDECLAKPSTSELVGMLRTLGYNATADGNGSLEVLIRSPEDAPFGFPGESVKMHWEAVSARLSERTFTVTAFRSGWGLRGTQALSQANRWNDLHFVRLYWHGHEHVRLQVDFELTKYSKANLQLLQRWLSAFVLATRTFPLDWFFTSERRLQFV